MSVHQDLSDALVHVVWLRSRWFVNDESDVATLLQWSSSQPALKNGGQRHCSYPTYIPHHTKHIHQYSHQDKRPGTMYRSLNMVLWTLGCTARDNNQLSN